jgi:allantoicase
VRLGAAGIVRGVVIDTGNFTGNYPEQASVEAVALEGNPSPAEVEAAEWTTLLAPADLKGDHENLFEIKNELRWTHIRLSIYPDGGVARFRVHGEVVPDPRWIIARHTIDLTGLEKWWRTHWLQR